MNYLLCYDFSMCYEWSIVLWIIYYVMIYELVSDIRKKKFILPNQLYKASLVRG